MPAQPVKQIDAAPRKPSQPTLVRELVRSCAPGDFDADEPCDGAGREVLLDLEVDGDRYQLIRFPADSAAAPTLSPREREIARLVAKGYPNKTIAAVLDLSVYTVCTHLRRVFTKLKVGSRAAMVARLIEEGAMNPHDSQA